MLHRDDLSWLDGVKMNLCRHISRQCECHEYMQQLKMIRRAGSHWWADRCEPDPERVEECEKKVLEGLGIK